MVNKFIGEVAAPEFGDDFTIRLDIKGQAEIETEFGAFDFANRMVLGLSVLSSAYLLVFLKASLRDGSGALVKELPEIPTPIAPICTKCLDAFALFRYGKDHETWVADNAKEVKTAANENPTMGTKASRSG